ncbi:B-block binding subunit of TFIIIC [Tanacetum coccineum]
METVVFAALEQICSSQAAGLTLNHLYPKLTSNGFNLCPNIKKALWTNLLNTPSIRFQCNGVSYDSTDTRIQLVELAENMELRIVASECLVNSFLGVYDVVASDAGVSENQRVVLERLAVASECLVNSFLGVYDVVASDSSVSENQRVVLERLAVARTDGIAQNDLAKELGIKNNKIFYVLQGLESRGLIVRQSTIIRKKEAGSEGEYKSGSVVNTNMIYLNRYAKRLGHLQRLEITKEDKTSLDNANDDLEVATGDGVSAERISDCVPAIRAICDRLEKAHGEVLVVSDLKKELGYLKSPGHRAWRNILKKLKDARLVEEFIATVNEKKVICLRLLKKFSPETFVPKSHGGGADDLDTEQHTKRGKRAHITDQLMELPIEQQIYDMIDAEGSKGLIINEVYKRLGIKNKRYYPQIIEMVSRFGMHMDSESHNKGLAYRVWTAGNFNKKVLNTPPGKSKDTINENLPTDAQAGKLMLTLDIQSVDCHTPNIYDEASEELNVDDPLLDSRSINSPHCDTNDIIPHAEEVSIANVNSVENEVSLVTSPPAKRIRRSSLTYPCIGHTSVSSQREQRILEKLQEDKVLLLAELTGLLESLENQEMKMDRKTVARSLNKLQKDGHCKCISVAFPSANNYGGKRTTDVVLHPSLFKEEDLSDRIHEKIRSFERQTRQMKNSKSGSFPVLNNVERIHTSVKDDIQAKTTEAMKNNGFVMAKMIRVKLLHVFLWGYLTKSPGWDDAISGKGGYEYKNPHSTCKLFELDAAVKAMPLELFLQVAGSSDTLESMVEKCRDGLCISDLPIDEYRSLMGTRATGLISNLIDILRRLKLIRLIGELLDSPVGAQTTLKHSIELMPYIEEPVQMYLPSTGVDSFDLRPHARHDFVLASRKDVDEYWNTLEYCYAASDPKAALHAFPGSVVHETFHSHSWSSARVMTAHQRTELFKLMRNDDLDKKISYKKCEKIAENLNLTLEQVLHVYYSRCRKNQIKKEAPKRKRSSKRKAVNNGNSLDKEMRKPKHAKISTSEDLTGGQNSLHETHMLLINEMDGQKEAVDDDVELSEDESSHSYSTIHESKLQYSERNRFTWTELKDRLLVIEYVKYHVALGAKFYRTDWASLKGLPAPPDTCARRMSNLNRNGQFKKAVLSLCNMLRVRGNDSSHFVLSQQFLHDIYSSPFLVKTGERAVKRAKWLHEKENDLLDTGVSLSSDLQCGDVLQLSVLMCSGEISMFPCLPKEGVGVNFNSKKCKSDDNEMRSVEIAKTTKLSGDGTRTDKGFPGIQLSLTCNLLPKVDAITLSRNENSSSPSSEHMGRILKSDGASESTWEAMTCYVRHLASHAQDTSPFEPNLFKTVYSAIQKAGDQGLSMKGISQITDVQGENMPELIVEVLEAFGRVLKVNAFDCVHVVDSLYRSKYLLASMSSHQHDHYLKLPETDTNDSEPFELQQKNLEDKDKNLIEETCRDPIEVHTRTDEVHHRVTILNYSEEVPQPINEVNANIETEMTEITSPPEEKCEFVNDDSPSYKPILPWINGDGTINVMVYKGLVRRALGIVMQNPGILEDHVVMQMNVLNPQSCRKLLELMILDNHVTVRKIYQSVSNEPPAMLHRLFGCSFKKPKLVSNVHLFANPIGIW